MLASDQGMLAAILIVAAALILLAAEALWPRRARVQPAPKRWRTHLGFAAINLPVERGVQALVLLAVYGAISGYPGTPGFGLLTLVDLPVWLIWIIAILALDLAVWLDSAYCQRQGIRPDRVAPVVREALSLRPSWPPELAQVEPSVPALAHPTHASKVVWVVMASSISSRRRTVFTRGPSALAADCVQARIRA